MAIRFRQDKNVLIADLERRGYAVAFVRQYSNGPGRSVDICLENGVRVYWDRHSRFVWAEGPAELVVKVETYLRRRYESGGVAHLVAAGLSACRAGAIGQASSSFLARHLKRRFQGRLDKTETQAQPAPFAEPEAFRLQMSYLSDRWKNPRLALNTSAPQSADV